MSNSLESQIKIDVSGSIIDCNWYYGCLFSPKKNVDIDADLKVGVGDNVHTDGNRNYHGIAEDQKTHHDFLENGVKNDNQLMEKSDESSTPCFGSSSSDSNQVWEEDADECLASMFRVLDEDGDGRVSADEIMRFLEKLSLEIPKEEVELAVRSVSACGDEFLTAMEFDGFYGMIFADKEEEVDNAKADEDQAICEAFGVFDKNGDGFISAMELADVLCRLGFVEGKDVNCCQSMIESVDYNGDGFVDIHEFRHLMTRSTSSLYPCIQCVATVN